MILQKRGIEIFLVRELDVFLTKSCVLSIVILVDIFPVFCVVVTISIFLIGILGFLRKVKLLVVNGLKKSMCLFLFELFEYQQMGKVG